MLRKKKAEKKPSKVEKLSTPKNTVKKEAVKPYPDECRACNVKLNEGTVQKVDTKNLIKREKGELAGYVCRICGTIL